MGSGASSETKEIKDAELKKPADASDITDLDAAKEEIKRLR